jgi:hypothetical protein
MLNDKGYEFISSDLINCFQFFTEIVNIRCDPIPTASKYSQIR